MRAARNQNPQRGHTSRADERRRRYHREYMRRWRADPHRERRERMNPEETLFRRKLKTIERAPRNLCRFCHQRPAVKTVLRLAPSLSGWFFKVMVPCCEEC